ncbi:MAG: DUF1156 domain-containing protein [Deltaproteobacteria bacterium]|nr:DUF1156 domain-containing protein [Deltaproteobacteria bacterium]
MEEPLTPPAYPKRLIEVDLPIGRISENARAERSLGPISTLHLWWARRPLAACRAVLLASLLPDPADARCSDRFRDIARANLARLALLPDTGHPPEDLRAGLVHLVTLISDRRAADDPRLLTPARELIAAAAPDLGAAPEQLLLDPFAGGGAIPVEALRLGVRVVASDLNPIPVMLNRLLVEAVPRLGAARITDHIDAAAKRVEHVARARLARVHPETDGRRVIAYVWARTIACEGPGCGIELPLLRSLWLDKKSSSKASLRCNRSAAGISFSVARGPAPTSSAIMRRGAATCPSCGYTTPNPSLRAQLARRRGGALDARLLAVVTTDRAGRGREFRSPTAADRGAVVEAARLLDQLDPAALPTEPISALRPSPNARGLSAITRIGVRHFVEMFTRRQALCMAVFVDAIRRTVDDLRPDEDGTLVDAVALGLAAALGRCADHWNSCCTWNPTGLKLQQMFKRQAVPVVWDFCEANPFGGSVGSWASAVECVTSAIKNAGHAAVEGTVLQADAAEHPLPTDTADILFTDPPYYDSVPYADLSDFFYVWHRRMLGDRFRDLFSEGLTPKDEEAIWNPSRKQIRTGRPKDRAFYEEKMRQSLAEARRVTKPSGLGVVVFAHKSTAGWEAVLSALIEAGWVATASWPLDTELGTRMNAMGTASLASSVHIVCRPRENPDGSLRTDDVGSWRSVLAELPKRIHDWMPRLAKEGVVGADAIFACLGPALEIFSRYSRVEKASGEVVALKEYLEQVWAAVAKEALSLMFEGADASGLEEDARLTAMWLWTLQTGSETANGAATEADDEAEDEPEDESPKKSKMTGGYVLEFDAARKIAQGLGAHLDKLPGVVEVKGDKARLLSVGERAGRLFRKDAGQDGGGGTKGRGKAKGSKKQLGLFAEIEAAEQEGLLGEAGLPDVGETTLDRVHQAMILFGAGRSEALKRFIVDEGAGRDGRFWKLAQSLSALYPASSVEKRWVDGVLARKKGLGF